MKNNNRTVIITGGGQGIGKGTAMRLLMEGFNVVIAEIDREAGFEAEKELSQYGRVKFIPCDVSNEEEVKAMVSETVKCFGGIDVLINNAAISVNKPITEISLEEWNSVLGVNLTGVFLCSKYCAPHLKERKGSIINMASTRAFMSEANTEAYSASKGGIFALTHALAISLGPDIRVNCISPGWIEVGEWKKESKKQVPVLSEMDHKQHPAGRVGRPEDIASMILFLIDSKNSFITGANFVVDGGMTRKMIYV
ncbi:SDR family oxidoreductase [Fonticella tunisiensis]|uniref:NAD(P)-dependent dehydrogenase (Short-subunit alcohol dehydrogenase family) n=1 Tax=Fonticella tunisiensis TaxID=1096341 RepID=A0A4R7KRV6_9CLOT|nr:SDR family oxidoreductase [Fonticella tunisiensis]TDT62296.1 NAD(P)-dependent dehydrogenase (short-subunit alcohol dehydrogenase family) [Fonticella tunisiensis]